MRPQGSGDLILATHPLQLAPHQDSLDDYRSNLREVDFGHRNPEGVPVQHQQVGQHAPRDATRAALVAHLPRRVNGEQVEGLLERDALRGAQNLAAATRTLPVRIVK